MVCVLTIKMIVIARPPQELWNVGFLHESIVPRQSVNIFTHLLDFNLILPPHKRQVVDRDRYKDDPLVNHLVVLNIVQHCDGSQALGPAQEDRSSGNTKQTFAQLYTFEEVFLS